MNLLLLEQDELRPDGTATLSGRRAEHARHVLGVQAGSALRVGVIGGRIGEGAVLSVSEAEVALRVELTRDPPPRAELDLVLALPRPKALRRILPALASLGVDRVLLLNAARVEKSYWTAALLQPASWRSLLIEGLEQAQDTRMPVVDKRTLFRPFVEDELDAWAGDATRWVAHPGARTRLGDVALPASRRVILAVGPDGGWVPFELELLASRGFELVTAGARTLRVEVAVPYLLGAVRRGASAPP